MGKAKQRYLRAIRKFQQVPKVQNGILGNSAGVVAVPNKIDTVYVTIPGTGTREVYNKRVANVPGMPVQIGYDPLEPKVYQVLGVINYPVPSSTSLATSTSSRHASTHNWSGNDPVFIEKRQLMPYRPTPIGGMYVYLGRDVDWRGQQWLYYTGSALDLSPAIPTTGSRYALVYAKETGGHGILTGTVRDLATLALSDVPTPIPGTTPLSIIRLYSGQTGIIEGLNDTDLVDVRQMFPPIWPNIYVTGTFNVDVHDAVNGQVLGLLGGKWQGVTGGGGGGSGDVFGPGSSVDENVVVFDGTDGVHIKDGGHGLDEYAELAGAVFTGHVDVGAMIRAVGIDVPSSGVGVEIFYSGGIGYILTYDRTSPYAFKITKLYGSELDFLIADGTTGSAATQRMALNNTALALSGIPLSGATDIGIITEENASAISTSTTGTSYIDVPNSSVVITPTISSTIIMTVQAVGKALATESLIVKPFIGASAGQEQVLISAAGTIDAPLNIAHRATGVSGAITCKLQFKSLSGAQVNIYNGKVIVMAIPET